MEAQQARLIEQVNEGILRVAEEEEKKLDARIKALEDLGKESRGPTFL